MQPIRRFDLRALLRGNRRFLVFLVALVFFRTAIADWNPIPSGSMRPTILEGDVVFVNRLAYDAKIPFTDTALFALGDPHRGDVVTFSSPRDGTRLIKRVVGLPGDVVAMRDNRLEINGVALGYEDGDGATETVHGAALHAARARESFGTSTHAVQWLDGVRARSTFGPVRVPEGEYLMLGDNRDNSEDSRYIGFVPRARIIGRAERILVSADILDHWQPRPSRFGESLQ